MRKVILQDCQSTILRKRIFIVGLLIAITATCYGTDFTFNTGSGSWGTSTNWTPNGIPGSGDNVTFNNWWQTISLDADRSCNNATLINGSVINLNGHNLTVNGNCDLSYSSGQESGLIVGNATLSIVGNLSIGNVKTSSTPATEGIRLDAGTVTVGGNITYNSSWESGAIGAGSQTGYFIMTGISKTITTNYNLSIPNFRIGSSAISKAGSAVLTISSVYDRNCYVAPSVTAGSISATGSTVNASCSTVYYSKSTGNLDVLTNWGTNTDGSGTNPSNFITANIIYYIRNNATPTIGAAWTVSGSSSKVVVGDGTNACNFTIPSSYALSTPAIDVANNATLTIANTTAPAMGNLATGSIVNYSGAGQTVASNNYYNLSFSGSGTKTLQTGTTTISGNLSLSGTASASTVVGLSINGNLSIGDGSTFTVAGYALSVSGTTTVGGGTSGSLIISSSTGTKTFTGLVTVNSGAIWNNSGNSAITCAGGITNNATFTAGSGVYTFQTNSQALTGSFSIPNVTITGVTLTNNGTLSVTSALTGTGGLTNAATGTLNIGCSGAVGIGTITASASGNTVNYNYNGNQTVVTTTYHHLTLSMGGTKTFSVTSINGNFTISSGATVAISSGLTIGGNFSNAGSCNVACNTVMAISGNFTNTGTLTGAGSGGIAKITVAGSSWNNNSGTICNDASFLDFCHASTATDHLSGTVGANLSYCTNSQTCIGVTLASANQVAAGNVTQNTTKNALSAFTLAVVNSSATLNQLVFTTTDTASLIVKYQLWYNTSNNLSSASQIGSDITTSLGTGNHTFSSLTQTINSSTTGYFWITADIQANATVSNTIIVSALSTRNFTLSGGSLTGSATAGGTQTIVLAVPAVVLASPNQTVSGIIGRSWTSTDIASFTLATSVANTSLSQIDFTTTGSVADGDLSNMKLWYNTTNTLNGATQIGSSITTSKGAGSHSFTSLAHTLTMGTTEYYWITIDVGSTATNAATIYVSAFTTANFTLTSGTKSGSTTNGGTQTIATPVTYYSRANGNWNVNATWSTVGYGGTAAGGFPTDVDIANIGNSNTVTLTGSQICTNLIIDAGAMLADGGNTLQIMGNITSNGTYSGSGKISLVNGYAEHQITSTNDNSLYKIELNDTWGAVISNQASSVKTTTLSNLSLIAGMLRIGDFNNGAVYNKLTISNAFTVASGTTVKFDGNCSGDITFNGAITISNGGSWTGTSGKTCSSIKMNAAFSNSSSAQTDNSNSTYTIANNSITMDAGTGMSVYNLTSLGVNSSLSGTWYVRNALNTAQFKMNANANLYVYGSLTSSADWVQCSSTSTLHYTTSGQTLLAQQFVCIVKIENGVTVNLPSGSFEARTNFILDNNSTVNITGTGTLNYQCAITLNAGSKLYINNGLTPNNFNSYTPTYNSTSTFEFGNNGSSYSLQIDPSKHTLSNFTMDNAGSSSTISLINSDATVTGNLTIGSNVTLTTNGSTRNISITGDFINNGTLDVTAGHIGTITLNGSTAQAISGSTSTTFSNLTINNTSSTGVTVKTAVTINGVLTLTDGNIYTTATNLLTLSNTATSTSGSDVSYVSGPMKKIGNTAFTFPTGKSGVWARIGFTPFTGFDGTTEISAEYFKTASTNANNLGTGIHNVSKIEYWDITRGTDPGNDASCNVTLYFNNKTRSVISATGSDLRTVHYESGVWTNKGGTYTDLGSGTGSITSTTPLTSYSPETVGSTDGSSSLPIELCSFTASDLDNHAVISWSTSSQTDNDYFTLERSSDGINWEHIFTCDGAGTSTVNNSYSYYDYSTLLGTEYYRLVQTDYDGISTISSIISIDFKSNERIFDVYPNPSRSDQMILCISVHNNDNLNISITNILGENVCTKNIIVVNQIKIYLSELCTINAGSYIIVVRGANTVLNKMVIIQ
jgi:hypothetical protein